jgi:hypothetical protein
MKTQHMQANGPPRRRAAGAGASMCCFDMYEAPPGTRGRPRKPRFKAETLLSNAAYVGYTRPADLESGWSSPMFAKVLVMSNE